MSTKLTLPALPFFVRDYLSATRMMTLNERGAYTDLLFFSWDTGPLPKDPARLATMLGCSRREFEAVWRAIGPKFVETDEGFISERLEIERRRCLQLKASASYKAGKAARARWGDAPSNPSSTASGNSRSNAPGGAEAMLEDCPPTPAPDSKTPPTPHNRGATSKGNGRAPRWIRDRSREAWAKTTRAIDAMKGTNRTWADVSSTLADSIADDAIKQTGGHRAIANRDRFTKGELERRFRDAYESALLRQAPENETSSGHQQVDGGAK